MRVFDGDVGDAPLFNAYDFAWGMTPYAIRAGALRDAVREVSAPTYGGGAAGSTAPQPVVLSDGSGLVTFNSDEVSDGLAGFVLTWALQPLQAPEQPAAPTTVDAALTVASARVQWTVPQSTIPLRKYLLEYALLGEEGTPKQVVLPSTKRAVTLVGLLAASTYFIRVQAWTTVVDASACADASNYRCSKWSTWHHLTTTANATVWYVSPGGSYLYGDGSLANPLPADLQGVINRAETQSGHEIWLMAGTYGDSFLTGAGNAQDLNMGGKLLSIKSLEGAHATVVDCGGSSRLITFNNSEPSGGRASLQFCTPTPTPLQQ